MIRLLTMLLVAVLAVGCGSSAPEPSRFEDAAAARAGDVRVAAFFAPDPPRQKDNVAWLYVTRGGEPVAEADVGVEAMMPEMGAMPEMRSRADVTKAADGIWRAGFDLEMGGGWTLEVTVDGRRADFAFTVGSPGLIGEEGSTAATPPAEVRLPDLDLDDDTVEALQRALDLDDEIRARLAHDTLSDVPRLAAELARTLDDAHPGAPEAAADWIALSRDAARQLADADDLDAARAALSEVNRGLVALASGEPALTEGRHVFSCPMTGDAFGKWIQRAEDLDNPYMGRAMPGCGVPTEWTSEGATPGQALYEDAAVNVDPVRRQRFGIRTEAVARREVVREIRAPGRVAFDETKVEDVTLTTGGWVRRLHVDTTGARVRRGQVLFEVYGPDLYAAQQEYLIALDRPEGDPLRVAAGQRLRLLGLTDGQVRKLAERGAPEETLPIVSPVSGYVVDKRIVEGSAFGAGDLLYRVAPLGTVWVEAEVYADDLGVVREGMDARIDVPNLRDASFAGRVTQLLPSVRPVEHTRTARIALDNPDERLLPGMYADVRLDVALGERIVVPHTAVLYTGPRRLVFVDAGEGRLVPREVRVGARLRDGWEIVDGLAAGDRVVTSGAFLVAAESRMKAATDLWEVPDAR